MAELKYVGPTASQSTDLPHRAYVLAAKSADMAAEDIDAQITDALSAYASKSYVDTQDSLNATKAFVDAGDASRMKLSKKDAANGVAGLDAGGRINRNRINATGSQRHPKGLWSPSSYGTTVSTSSSEVTVFPVTVTDPGHAYKMVVLGCIDGISGSEGAAPLIQVRVGSTSGPVIASGRGTTESYDYFGIDLFGRTAPTLGGGWQETWSGGGTGHAETDGNSAIYVKQGTGYDRRGIFRRIGTDATTAGDYHEVEWTNSSDCQDGNELLSFLGHSAHNYVLGRLSSDGQYYCGFDLSANKANFIYAAGGGMVAASPVNCDNTSGAIFRARFGVPETTEPRRFQLLRNGSLVVDHSDTGNATALGSTRRGWGFGFMAGNFEIAGFSVNQATPASLDYIKVKDTNPGVNYTASAPITILPTGVASQSARTGSTTLYVCLSRVGSAGTVYASTAHKPTLSVLALPA